VHHADRWELVNAEFLREVRPRRPRGRPSKTYDPGMSGPADIDLVAASLRADSGDVRIYVEQLARKLEEAFPGRCSVKRSGMLGKGPVRLITVAAGDGRYELEHKDGSVAARRTSVVRGIALKTEELGLEQWIDSLAAEVMAEAARSESGRLALENLLIGNASEEAT